MIEFALANSVGDLLVLCLELEKQLAQDILALFLECIACLADILQVVLERF